MDLREKSNEISFFLPFEPFCPKYLVSVSNPGQSYTAYMSSSFAHLALLYRNRIKMNFCLGVGTWRESSSTIYFFVILFYFFVILFFERECIAFIDLAARSFHTITLHAKKKKKKKKKKNTHRHRIYRRLLMM
jgi:hypothetical protein